MRTLNGYIFAEMPTNEISEGEITLVSDYSINKSTVLESEVKEIPVGATVWYKNYFQSTLNGVPVAVFHKTDAIAIEVKISDPIDTLPI